MQQIAVYEEFSRSIPGFIPVGGVQAPSGGNSDISSAGAGQDLAAGAGHPGAPFMAKPPMVGSTLTSIVQSLLDGYDRSFEL